MDLTVVKLVSATYLEFASHTRIKCLLASSTAMMIAKRGVVGREDDGQTWLRHCHVGLVSIAVLRCAGLLHVWLTTDSNPTKLDNSS
jgi:hypothetical protein